MSTLTDNSLEFAREHINKFYDSDFFPKPAEYGAIWHFWGDVKKELMSKNVGKMMLSPPRTMTIPKSSAGFRVVHQLEPLDAIVYTALAYEVASDVEAARIPPDQNVACSYRIKIQDGSFFANEAGWNTYINKIEELAATHKHVLATDITDFYNQIYLHRLQNAIEYSNKNKKNIADDIERFITTLNGKASKGVPVGPAPSIIMAEAVLIDVDAFLRNEGFAHTRYVDDFRIFSNSTESLEGVLERLTLYLYENHRLTLSSEKTQIAEAADFVQKTIHSQKAEEKRSIFETLDVFNPYTGDFEEVVVELEEDSAEVLLTALKRVIAFGSLDLGLARGVIRSAKRAKEDALVQLIVQHLSYFEPVIGDVVLYWDEVTKDDDVTFAGALAKVLYEGAIKSNLGRFWIEWLISKRASFLKIGALREYVDQGDIVNRARAAITTSDIAWVRSQKAGVYNLPSWGRRAALMSGSILPSDERKHWLGLFANNSPIPLDRWVANWIIEAGA